MVDRASFLSPPDLRYSVVETIEALGQLDVAKFPEGAKACVFEGFNSFGAFGQGGGNMEWMYTRQQPLTPLNFVSGSASQQQTPSGNCILAKDGNLWIRIPSVYLVTLNGTTPVVVDDVANQLGNPTPSQANVIASHSRQGPGATTGHVIIIAGSTAPTGNQLSVSSTEANDAGQIRILQWPFFRNH